MFTVLWCYLRNSAFKKDGVNYEVSADLTGQANHMGVTIEADIIKQKQPENNGGYTAVGFGKTDPLVYDQLTTDNPIDLTRWQVVNCYAGRIGLINSGGESKGDSDLAQAVRTAVINKRAGGMGLIVGRKAFQRPMAEGAALIHAIQDVYLTTRSPSPEPDGSSWPAVAGRPECRGATGVRPGVYEYRGPNGGFGRRVPRAVPAGGANKARRSEPGLSDVHEMRRGSPVASGTQHVTEQLDQVIVRFAGDSGDGMQLTGDRFTTSSALLGNDMSTFPDFPAEIRAPPAPSTACRRSRSISRTTTSSRRVTRPTSSSR